MADEEQIKPGEAAQEEVVKEEVNQEAAEEKPEAAEEAKEEVKKDDNPPAEEPLSDDKVEEKLKDKGFDFEELKKEYYENGDLTEETRKKLNDIGLSNEFINDFIEAKKAQAQLEEEKLIGELSETVGGRDKYDEIINWASKNLEADEIKAINEVHDKSAMKFILAGLKTRMEVKEGILPTQLQSGKGSATADIFESQAQMFEAIRDPRYKNDPAYAAKVTAKIRASRAAGIDLGV